MPHGLQDRAPGHDASVVFDHERLDAYRVALNFQSVAAGLARRLTGTLRDQLDRASLSLLLNLAEGVGRTHPGDKARFYAISRGSATECAALVDVLQCRGLAEASRCRDARGMLVRLVQMTTKLEQAMGRRKGRLGANGRTASASGR